MFFMAFLNIVFLSAPIKTTLKNVKYFKYDHPTSLNFCVCVSFAYKLNLASFWITTFFT